MIIWQKCDKSVSVQTKYIFQQNYWVFTFDFSECLDKKKYLWQWTLMISVDLYRSASVQVMTIKPRPLHWSVRTWIYLQKMARNVDDTLTTKNQWLIEFVSFFLQGINGHHVIELKLSGKLTLASGASTDRWWRTYKIVHREFVI